MGAGIAEVERVAGAKEAKSTRGPPLKISEGERALRGLRGCSRLGDERITLVGTVREDEWFDD